MYTKYTHRTKIRNKKHGYHVTLEIKQQNNRSIPNQTNMHEYPSTNRQKQTTKNLERERELQTYREEASKRRGLKRREILGVEN